MSAVSARRATRRSPAIMPTAPTHWGSGGAIGPGSPRPVAGGRRHCATFDLIGRSRHVDEQPERRHLADELGDVRRGDRSVDSEDVCDIGRQLSSGHRPVDDRPEEGSCLIDDPDPVVRIDDDDIVVDRGPMQTRGMPRRHDHRGAQRRLRPGRLLDRPGGGSIPIRRQYPGAASMTCRAGSAKASSRASTVISTPSRRTGSPTSSTCPVERCHQRVDLQRDPVPVFTERQRCQPGHTDGGSRHGYRQHIVRLTATGEVNEHCVHAGG